MNREILVAVANKVSDENSVTLFQILKKMDDNPKLYDDEDWENDLRSLCLLMLAELEGEEE